jgi:pimeloyl-ACP methyl ester carboxylesterase
MSPRLVPAFLLAVLLLVVRATPIRAQMVGQPVEGKDYELYEFDAGENYRTHVRGLFDDPEDGRRVLFLGPEAVDCNVFLRTAFNEEGWAYAFADRGWSAFTQDLPGSNASPPPSNPDIVALTEASIESVFRTASAVYPRVVIAQGLGAAFAMKLRSTTPTAIPAAILIDPWGVKGVNPPLDLDADEVAAYWADLEDHLWVEWGLGPEPGKSFEDQDLGEEGFLRLLEYLDRDAPSYWATVDTGLQTWMQILNPVNIAQWPVLVVRGAHSTPDMDARREAVTTWLEEHGAHVEVMDLGEEGPADLSNMPMAGRNANAVAELFFEWCKDLPDNPKFPATKSRP